MDVAGLLNRVGRSAAEDLSGRVFEAKWPRGDVRQGPARKIARGGATAGKNSPTMVSGGTAPAIGLTPKQGIGRGDMQLEDPKSRKHERSVEEEARYKL